MELLRRKIWNKATAAFIVSLFSIGVPAALADAHYNAASGTLPQAQGFTYSGDNGNPSPFISGGLLYENTTVGEQYWTTIDPSIDFSKSVMLEGSLLINSSNFVPRIPDGSSREGYYFMLGDSTGEAYTIGLASSGFVINDYPGKSLTPYPFSGGFHVYRLTINGNQASFSIDGTIVQTGIEPEPPGISPSTTSMSFFGAVAGLSVSNTELRYFCYSTSGSPCTPASVFVPVTPCRIADTRNADGTFGGPSLAGGQVRSFPIPSSPCGIPNTATAYSLNVTVAPPGPLFYLTIWPTGLPQPNVSTLNDLFGQIIANAAIVPAGIDAQRSVSVYVSDSTQVILDINGYFTPAQGTSGSQ